MTTVLAVILDVTDMTGRDPGGAVNAVVSAEFAVMIARTPLARPCMVSSLQRPRGRRRFAARSK